MIEDYQYRVFSFDEGARYSFGVSRFLGFRTLGFA
jgi:hypothetical protein